MVDGSVFKGYDIRGIYPTQIDEEGAYRIGRAFVEYLNVKEVAVGRDARISSPSMTEELIKGINDAGAKVINLGVIGTEVMYFAVGHYQYESGIMVTSSHNPAEYNGMKLVKKGPFPIGGDTGLYDIRDKVISTKYDRLNKPRNVEEVDPTDEFRKKINSIVDLSKLPKLKVVVDAGNGVGGLLFEKIFSGTSLEIVPMYFEPDGNFPNHEANPIKEENVEELKKRVVGERADLGIALDGDGDRVFFIDESGEFSLGYYIMALLSKKILEKDKGRKVVHENRLRWAIEDAINEAGGIPVLYKAGHSYLKEKMREVDAVFSGETSSHFFYEDLYYADSSMLTIALLLEVLRDENKTLGQILADYRAKYFISGEINFEVEDADSTLAKFKSHYISLGEQIDEIDGVAVEHGRKWRISLRKSNTEPLVRLNVEANDPDLVKSKVAEAEALIKS